MAEGRRLGATEREEMLCCGLQKYDVADITKSMPQPSKLWGSTFLAEVALVEASDNSVSELRRRSFVVPGLSGWWTVAQRGLAHCHKLQKP